MSLKKKLNSVIILSILITTQFLMVSCGGDESDGRDNSITPVEPNNPTHTDAEDAANLIGYWVNEDNSCILEFIEEDGVIKVESRVPYITVPIGYLSWDSGYNVTNRTFSLIVHSNSGCPAIKVRIIRQLTDSFTVEKIESSQFDLSSKIFSRATQSEVDNAVANGWINLFLKPTGEISGHKYVDLGLSVKWAYSNLTSMSIDLEPTGFGEYFAFGEIRQKSSYTRSNYKFKDYTVAKYQKENIIDNNLNLTPAFDAATELWGSNWKTPDNSEMQELITRCDRKKVNINGIEGLLIIGSNGNCIFLPASGAKTEYGDKEIGVAFRYGTSTLASANARYVFSCFDNSSKPRMEEFVIENGYSIRPVLR